MSDQKQGDFDLDEDLFDFGGVGPEPEPAASEENLEEIFATFRAEAASEELATAEAAHASTPAPARSAPAAPSAAHAPLDEPAPAARPPRAPAAPAAPAQTHAPAAAHTAEPVLVPVARAARYSKGLVAIALSVTVLNAALAVVMLRNSSPSHDEKGTEEQAAHAAQPEEHAPEVRPAPHADALPDPEAVTPAHGHPTLDEARAELARGDHAAARRRVYGLLAIVDRLEDPRKSEIEAECQYLIAQSLHLEALARMGAHE